MYKILVILLFTAQISFTQKNSPPQFYTSNFTMPEHNPVRTDGFYTFTYTRYDSLFFMGEGQMSGRRKAEKFTSF
jgi:hypothetical protein